MLVRCIFTVMVCCLIACKGEADSPSPVIEEKADKNPHFTMVSYTEEFASKTQEDFSWLHEFSYPNILQGGTEEGRLKANQLIDDMVKVKYCEALGDRSFSATVHHINQNIMSFSYHNMYMCENSVRPSSSTRALTIDLHTGKVIDLHLESKDKPTYEALTAKVTSDINHLLSKKDPDLSCEKKVSDWFYYVTDDAVVFNYYSPYHEQVNCDTAIIMKKAELKTYLKTNSFLIQ